MVNAFQGRFHAEVTQGLRCRHERRWADNCTSCGRPDGAHPGLELLRLSDELALERRLRDRSSLELEAIAALREEFERCSCEGGCPSCDIPSWDWLRQRLEELERHKDERDDLLTRIEEMDVDLAAAEADKEHLATYLAERNRELSEARAEIEAIRVAFAAIPLVAGAK